jgi:hypothetical protein
VGRDGRYIALIWVSEKPKYFCKGDWTGQISLIPLQKIDFWRRRSATRRAGFAEPIRAFLLFIVV